MSMGDDEDVKRFPVWLRPSRWGVQIRSAVVSALVVGVVLLAAAGAMLGLLRHSLLRELDAAADVRTGQIADELRADDGDQLPDGLLTTEREVAAVQVLGPDGRARWSSVPNPRARHPADPQAPLTDPATVPPAGHVTGLPAAAGYDDDLRVAARTVRTPSGTYTILAAANSESAEHAMTEVAGLLAMGGPVVVLTAAAATYLLVGRSLRSVEAIRARVDRIGATALSQRVPVPLARDEIARLAETMNEMLARVEAGHQAQRRFVGDASHELRSPLATLTAALELARDRPQVLDRDLISGTLLPEAERMRHLVEDLLTLAAADEDRLELRIGEVDLDDLVDAEATALRLRGDVAVQTSITPVRVIGDRPKLTRTLRNLTDNAAAHTRTRVAIEITESGDRARIVVDDDGPGIPNADRERVFGRFVRLEADRARSSGGSGLGLAIVAEIVAAHDGTVTVGESPWGGARFVVELPVSGPVGVQQPVSDPA